MERTARFDCERTDIFNVVYGDFIIVDDCRLKQVASIMNSGTESKYDCVVFFAGGGKQEFYHHQTVHRLCATVQFGRLR